MTARIINITQLDSPDVIEFIKNIDGDFIENNNISAAPWRYFGLPNFHFQGLFEQDKLSGISVISRHSVSEHLNFLYVLPGERSRGFGRQLIQHWLDHVTKPIQTIHVRTELKRTRQYYLQFGFIELPPNEATEELQLWVQQCLQFNLATYQNAVLMYRKPLHKPQNFS